MRILTKAKKEYFDPERIRNEKADLAVLYQTWRSLNFGDYLGGSDSVKRIPIGTHPFQAQLLIDEGEYWVHPLGTQDGISVEQADGRRITARPGEAVQLKKGQVLQLENRRLKFVRPEASTPEEAFEVVDERFVSLPISPEKPGIVSVGRDPGPDGVKLPGAAKSTGRRQLKIGATPEGYWIRASDRLHTSSFVIRNNAAYLAPVAGWFKMEAGDLIIPGGIRSQPRYSRQEAEERVGQIFGDLDVPEEVRRETAAWGRENEEGGIGPLRHYFLTRDDFLGQSTSFGEAYRLTPDGRLECVGETEIPPLPAVFEQGGRRRPDHFPRGTIPNGVQEPEWYFTELALDLISQEGMNDFSDVISQKQMITPDHILADKVWELLPEEVQQFFEQSGSFWATYFANRSEQDLRRAVSNGKIRPFLEETASKIVKMAEKLQTIQAWENYQGSAPLPLEELRETLTLMLRFEEEGSAPETQIRRAIATIETLLRNRLDPENKIRPVLTPEELSKVLRYVDAKKASPLSQACLAEYRKLHEQLHQVERLSEDEKIQKIQDELKRIQNEMTKISPFPLEEKTGALKPFHDDATDLIPPADLSSALEDPDLLQRAVKGLILELYPSLYWDPVSEVLSRLAKEAIDLIQKDGVPKLDSNGTLTPEFPAYVTGTVENCLEPAEEIKREAAEKRLDRNTLTERVWKAIAL